jgi:hypothetical protein
MKAYLWMSSRSHLKVDSEGTASATAKCIEDILVLACIRRDVLSVRQHRLDFHDVVHAQA